MITVLGGCMDKVLKLCRWHQRPMHRGTNEVPNHEHEGRLPRTVVESH